MQRPLARGMGFFSLIWVGEVVSMLGSGMSSFAIGAILFQETRSVTLYSFIGLSLFLPVILLSPIAGVVADRFDRRMILVVGNLGSIAGALFLYRLVSTGELTSWHLYPIIAFKAVFASFIWPALSAATTLIVGRQHFGRAAGMNQMGMALANILAPLLGGLAVVPLGIQGVVLLDICSFLVAIVVLLTVRFPQPEPLAAKGPPIEASTADVEVVRPPEDRKAAEAAPDQGSPDRGNIGVGWAFLRRHSGLLWLLGMVAVLQFCVGIVNVLMSPLVLSFAGIRELGVVLSVAGTGSLVGGIVMSVWGGPSTGHRVRAILTVTAVNGTVLLAGGMRPNLALVASAAFCFLFAFPILVGSSQAIWQSKTPPRIQGRVFALRRMIAGGSLPLAYAVAGPLADHVFEPMLMPGGGLAASLGRFVGVGPGRGMGMMLVIFGVAMVVLVLVASRFKQLRELESAIPDAVEDDAETAVAKAVEDRSRPLPRLPRLALGLALVALALLVLRAERPPTSFDAPPLDGISIARMQADLAEIAARPHPTGSAELARVRDVLTRRLDELGLEVEIQRGPAVLTVVRYMREMTVENVIARLPGRDSEAPAVLLVAHYDSVASGPGAADNGSAVVALLETARLLSAGERLRNDVVFLFTDAEEFGLGGALAFVEQHPLAERIGMVLNFDARGHGGPLYLFETGYGNAESVEHFAAAAPAPRGSSLLHHIYQKLPNDTDFTVFREAGYAGFNTAYIEGLTHYHSSLDRAENVSPASMLHQAGYALSLARYFGDVDLAEIGGEVGAGQRARVDEDAPNDAFFHVLGRLVVYPAWFSGLLAALAALAYGALIYSGLRGGGMRFFGLWQGIQAFLGIIVAIPVGVTLIWLLGRDFLDVPVVMGSVEGAAYFMFGFAVLALGGFLGAIRFFRQAVSAAEMAAAALFWWLVLLAATSGWWLPMESNVLLAWPMLGGLVAFAWHVRRGGEGENPWTRVLVLLFAALPGLLLLVPFCAALYVGLQSIFELGGAALMIFMLLLGLLIVQIEAIIGERTRPAMAVCAVVGIALLAVGVQQAKSRGVKANSVLYTADADTGEERWLSLDTQPDLWTTTFGFRHDHREDFGAFFPSLRRALMASPAQGTALDAPRLEVVSESRLAGDLVLVDLRLRTDETLASRALWFEPHEAVMAVQMGGRSLQWRTDEEWWEDKYSKMVPAIQRIPVPHEEVLRVVLRVGEKVTLHVVDQKEGLPPLDEVRPRPEGMIARPLLLTIRSDVSLVRRGFEIGG